MCRGICASRFWRMWRRRCASMTCKRCAPDCSSAQRGWSCYGAPAPGSRPLRLRRCSPDVDLDAAVELAAFRRVVRRLRLGLAVADRVDASVRDALIDEEALDRIGALFGEALVVVGSA